VAGHSLFADTPAGPGRALGCANNRCPAQIRLSRMGVCETVRIGADWRASNPGYRNAHTTVVAGSAYRHLIQTWSWGRTADGGERSIVGGPAGEACETRVDCPAGSTASQECGLTKTASQTVANLPNQAAGWMYFFLCQRKFIDSLPCSVPLGFKSRQRLARFVPRTRRRPHPSRHHNATLPIC
jgi:hypothetical protein